MDNSVRKVYADNAATTAVSEEVLNAMLPFFRENYGNPSSLYSLGQQAKAPLEQARATVAQCLGAKPNEIYFTSCGSESDNWAIKGAARAQRSKQGKTHIITSAFEHHAVLHTCQALERGDSIEATAQICGYNSSHTFRRAFKKRKGILPSDYRDSFEGKGRPLI